MFAGRESDEGDEEEMDFSAKATKKVKTKDIQSFFTGKPQASSKSRSAKAKRVDPEPLPKLVQRLGLKRTSALI